MKMGKTDAKSKARLQLVLKDLEAKLETHEKELEKLRALEKAEKGQKREPGEKRLRAAPVRKLPATQKAKAPIRAPRRLPPPAVDEHRDPARKHNRNES